MNITLYKNLSEQNVVNKKLSSILSLFGSLKNPSSVIDPVLTIESDSSIVFANYLYIEEWGRYYYITNISSIRNNLWLLNCHVDVLYTYRSQIKSQSGIVARQENLYNLYLDDDKFLVDAQRIYWTKAFPGRVNAASAGGSSFILTLAGGE